MIKDYENKMLKRESKYAEQLRVVAIPLHEQALRDLHTNYDAARLAYETYTARQVQEQLDRDNRSDGIPYTGEDGRPAMLPRARFVVLDKDREREKLEEFCPI